MYPFGEEKIYVDEIIKDKDEEIIQATKKLVIYDELLNSIQQCRACNIFDYKKDIVRHNMKNEKKIFFLLKKKPEENKLNQFLNLLKENEIELNYFHFIYAIKCSQSEDINCCFHYALKEILLLNPLLFISFGKDIKNIFDKNREYNKIYNFQEKIAWLPFYELEEILEDEKINEIFISKIKEIYSKIKG